MTRPVIEVGSVESADPRLIAGRFQILGLLGSGGSASVFEAHDHATARAVALKILHPHLSTSPAMRTGFLLEADAAENLRHPNIAMILGYGVHGSGDEGLAWIALELASGSSLAEHVRRNGALALDDALAVADAVLSALEAAHALGLVHRDVSPANVMVGTREGGPIRAADVRLVDFGLADVIGRSALGSDIVRSRATGTVSTPAGVLGNVNYMSPEQVLGQPVDERGDIYQAGATLYFALTGCAPYVRATPEAVMRAHLEAPPPVPSVLGVGIPSAVDHIIVTAMNAVVTGRFSSAAEMRLAVRGVRARDGQVDHTRRFDAPSALLARRDVTAAYRRRAPRMDGPPHPRGELTAPSSPRLRVRGLALAIVTGAIVSVLAIAWSLAASDAPGASFAASPSTSPTPLAQPATPTTMPSRQVSAPTTIAVPRLVALSLDDARKTLVAAGLTLGVVSVSDSPAGGQRVLSVGGGEGSAVPPGTPIDLVVASGSNFVPRVVGLTVSSAIEAIRGAGFTAVRHNQADSDHASDTVLGSSPGETALLPVGAEVVIDVSVAPVVVPTGTPSPTPSSSPSPSATPTIP